MFENVDAYPLAWPMTWPRTESYRRKKAQFADRSLAAARDVVLDELRLLGARFPIISTNVILRLDGLPKSGQKTPADPGVAVYFALKGSPKVLACDCWRSVEENLWAIGKHIEALRGQRRWGVGSIEQAFMGYPALAASKVYWWKVLGVERGADLETIQAAYRAKVRVVHPDMGGSQDEFLKVQTAWDEARYERKSER